MRKEEVEGIFGPWMVTQKQRRRPMKPPIGNGSETPKMVGHRNLNARTSGVDKYGKLPRNTANFQ